MFLRTINTINSSGSYWSFEQNKEGCLDLFTSSHVIHKIFEKLFPNKWFTV